MKKLAFLLNILAISSPLVITSCNFNSNNIHNETKENRYSQFQYLLEKYYEENNFKRDTTFILDLVMKDDYLKYFKYKPTGEYYFDTYIDSVQDFNELVIDRFYELLSKTNIKDRPTKEEIVKEFESKFLNNKKLEEVLDKKRLYLEISNDIHFFDEMLYAIKDSEGKFNWVFLNDANSDEPIIKNNVIINNTQYLNVFVLEKEEKFKTKNFFFKSKSQRYNYFYNLLNKKYFIENKEIINFETSMIKDVVEISRKKFGIKQSDSYLLSSINYNVAKKDDNFLNNNHFIIKNELDLNTIFEKWYSILRLKNPNSNKELEIKKAKKDFEETFLENKTFEEVLLKNNIFIFEAKKDKYRVYKDKYETLMVTKENDTQIHLTNIRVSDFLLGWNNWRGPYDFSNEPKSERWLEVVIIPKNKEIIYTSKLKKSDLIVDLSFYNNFVKNN
nr:hypothetical protein [Mycoplasmopsis canis]WQQ12651.1 hypothetical protein RRG48_01220 [Mycoplasmopsis canis]